VVSDDHFRKLREQMVEHQLMARGIHSQRVLAAMRHIPRHEFLAPELRHLAYQDSPQPIGEQQTISQPYIVALMSQELLLTGVERVLEVGTGSGYQTAILCELGAYVYSLERYPRLAEQAAEVLNRLGCPNVDIHVGDGSQGLPDMAPFDAIIVTAAAPALPGPLCSQLRDKGGRMIIPVGDDRRQILQRVTRWNERLQVEKISGVKFVPLLGRYGYKPPPE
jgi:protein-L-isoaspartate(D-aspartate) O-methyltransferase